MSEQTPDLSGPLDLQHVIEHFAATHRGHPLEETVHALTLSLAAAGHTPPSNSWLDAVARAAVHGSPYVVSGTAQLADHGLTLGSPLQEAPADIHPARPDPHDVASDASSPILKRAQPTSESQPSPVDRRLGSQKRARAAALVLLAALALMVALFRRKRRAGTAARPGPRDMPPSR